LVKKKMNGKHVHMVIGIALAAFALGVVGEPAHAQLSGAIFTTLEDGTRVNANIYKSKEEVYLDGGPGPNAPITAAGLPDGWYYFQVTDPSGKVLLSTDPVKCRAFLVVGGVISEVDGSASSLQKVKGKMVDAACAHDTGDDQDWGATTVQLMPYDDSPNNGDEYKVWATPVDYFVGDPELVDNPEYFHGFVPHWSKTDNFKVRHGKPTIPPVITVLKFKDCDADGHWDVDEEEIPGWPIQAEDPLFVTNCYYTPAQIVACNPGVWTITEADSLNPGESWLQTALIIDGVDQPVSKVAPVTVAGFSEETHQVIYGNIPLGSITACKFYDRNGNGTWDLGGDDPEPPVAGIRFTLTGVNVRGEPVDLVAHTGDDGCAVFSDLLPGVYTLTEELPTNCNWQATTPDVIEGILIDTCAGPANASHTFGNKITGLADFGTKGYWHNKNGLTEITCDDDPTTDDDVQYINGLAPYAAASSYFEEGDEPFDGYFSDGFTPVPAAYKVKEDGSTEEIWGAGTCQAEISQFLVGANAGGDPREQLAQQLLAFILNVRHRLGGDGAVQLPDGSFKLASELIAEAIAAWSTGTASEQNQMQELLNALNESDALPYIFYEPCEVIYPEPPAP